MLGAVRLLLVIAAIAFAGCAPAPMPVARPAPDIAREEWYPPTVEQLAALHREAASLLQRGKRDEAAAVVMQGQPLQNRVLAAARPTLAAMEAASDLDDLYGRMLLANRHYGWARLLFQKNAVRWKNRLPQTADTARRLKEAAAGLAECDRHLGE
jgi:hypothetical protein